IHHDSCPLDSEVYVGNLRNNGKKTKLEQALGYYGPLRSVSRNRGPPASWGPHPRDDYRRRSLPLCCRSPRRRSFSHSQSRFLSRNRRRERPLSWERNHKLSRSYSRSHSRSRSNERKYKTSLQEKRCTGNYFI
uniref:Uncharacterized protein n=1 Tax=Theropithecus gelada TaxID=9565 RepID=A0A8D2FKK6_THEGE